MQWIQSTAKICGFSHWAYLAPDHLEFLPEVRSMCASGRCGAYGKRWCCPPACGTLEEIAAVARSFPHGILLQTTAYLDDAFDYETMMAAEQQHKENMRQFVAKVRRHCRRILPMGSGACRLCEECTYPKAPCRFPEQMVISMEAYGLLVSKVCEDCNLPYRYGENTITYTGCVLYE